MTITVGKPYEVGKTYKMFVLFADKNGKYLNVRDDGNAGFATSVEVEGELVKPLHLLKDKTVELVCTDVTEKGPEFALSKKYFKGAYKILRGGNVGVDEGKNVEFKTSLVYKAATSQPDSDQPFEIAKQIAAFMNTDGGDLYLGVDDDGYVTGIEGDLPKLGEVKIMMQDKTDETWSYSANADGYRLKLTNAVRFYLGDAAAALLEDIEEKVDETSGLTYFKVHVNPSDEIVYLGREESVVFRAGPSVVFLKGRQRDQYVKQRFFLKGEKSAKEAVEEYKKQAKELEESLKKKTKELEAAMVKGAASGVGGMISTIGKSFRVAKGTALPLDEKFLGGLDRPKALVYRIDDPAAYQFRPVKTWMEFYEALLRICADKDSQKFEVLPDSKEFAPQRKGAKTKPNFVRRNDRIKLKSASGYLGAKNDVRANLAGISKASFLDPKKLPLRLMAHFGINPADVRVWSGE